MLAGRARSGDHSLAGCETVQGQVQQVLPLPWSPQEWRDLEAITAASVPALKKAVLAVAEAAARKRQREDAASSIMDSISHAVVHGGAEEGRRAAFIRALRARLSASLPLVKDVQQKMPTLTPEVCMQATADMIDSLGLNLLPVSKRAVPAKASRVQTTAVLQRTFKTSPELEILFGPRWYIEYSVATSRTWRCCHRGPSWTCASACTTRPSSTTSSRRSTSKRSRTATLGRLDESSLTRRSRVALRCIVAVLKQRQDRVVVRYVGGVVLRRHAGGLLRQVREAVAVSLGAPAARAGARAALGAVGLRWGYLFVGAHGWQQVGSAQEIDHGHGPAHGMELNVAPAAATVDYSAQDQI